VRCDDYQYPALSEAQGESRMSKMRENQLTVPLSEPLREYLEQAAAREHRSVAGQVRHIVAEAAARTAQTEERAA
jgi:hypothetical protein